jgi:hypothetical protein
MAISTIKYDAFNKTKRAKYRIVILGNLNYHQWSKESTVAPVMSQLELRILTSLAVHHKCTLKNCDIKQAFVQSSLPPSEEYFVRPLVGCPKSAPGTYWHLIRSLYGLKHAPKLWYEKLRSHLQVWDEHVVLLLLVCFLGLLLKVQHPFHLLSTIGEVNFMGQVTHFLGIEFMWHHHVDGNVSFNTAVLH